MVLAFYRKIEEALQREDELILLLVTWSKGSSPGRAGFKMLVSNKTLFGSIGGGMMEHKMVEYARHLLNSKSFAPFTKKQIHRAEEVENRSGMICSGEQEIAFYKLTREHAATIRSILDSASKVIQYTNNGIRFLNEHNDQPTTQEIWFEEPLAPKNKAYIIGGGHVSLALCQVLSPLDFEIHVLDDRAQLNTMTFNDYAHSKKVIDFNQVESHIPEGDRIYVIVMSFGFRTDKMVLKQLLGKHFKYLGMMGSEKKNETLFRELKEEGYPESELAKVKAPIGLSISSKTPYEIAISVAAEIIAVKNSKGK